MGAAGLFGQEPSPGSQEPGAEVPAQRGRRRFAAKTGGVGGLGRLGRLRGSGNSAGLIVLYRPFLKNTASFKKFEHD